MLVFSMSKKSLRNRAKCVLLASVAVPALYVCSATMVFAQTTASLPVTVVTSARYEQSIQDVLADLTVIDRAEIERYGAGSISELLSRLPGIQSVDVGAPQIFIRGANANATAIYIDGVRVETHDRNGGAPPLSIIDLAHVQRVEVVRGAASSLYGANAMGGVIQIFTFDGESRKWASFGVGSEGLLRGGFGLSANVDDKWSYRLGLQRVASDGYDTAPTVNNKPSDLAWHSGALNAGIDLQVDPRHQVSYVLNANSHDEFTYYYANARVIRNSVISGINWKANWSDRLSSKVSLGNTKFSYKKDTTDNYVTSGNDLAFTGNFASDSGVISVGLERKIDRLKDAGDQYNNAIFKSRGQSAALIGWSNRVGQLSWQLNAREDKDGLFGSYSSGGAAVAYDITPRWRVSAGANTGFRAPTIEQTTGSYGSAAVKPETSNGKELRLRYKNGVSEVQTAIYRTNFRDMIATNAAFKWENINNASVEGLTLGGKTLFGIATVSGSLDLMRARNNATGLPLNYRPDESATADISAPVSGWTLGGQWQAVGQRYFNSGVSALKGYALLNVHASKKIDANWTLQARVDNVANRDYEGDGYYATPDRRVFVGLKWQGK